MELRRIVRGKRGIPAGFNMMEMLTVIAVISTLMSIIMPAMTNVRENSRRVVCTSNLQQIGVALAAYEKEFRYYPPGEKKPSSGSPSWNWPVFLLDNLDQSNLAKRLNLKKSPFAQEYDWVGNQNQQVSPLSTVMPFLLCPSTAHLESGIGGGSPTRTNDGRIADLNGNSRVDYDKGEGFGCMDYAGCRGPAASLFNPVTGRQYEQGEGVMLRIPKNPADPNYVTDPPRVSTKSVTDGLKYTIIVAECTGRGANTAVGKTKQTHGAWATATDSGSSDTLIAVTYGMNPSPTADMNAYRQGADMFNTAWNNDEFVSEHARGCNTLFCDGSVRFLNDTMALNIQAALASRGGGERIGEGADGFMLLP